MNVASLIPVENGELNDFEIEFVSDVPNAPYGAVIGTHTVRSKNVKNALVSFNKAVPNHGPIKSIRKVAPK